MKVETLSKGKTKERNEDVFGYSDACFVIADGATDKSGKIYNGKTGGELIAKLAVEQSLQTNLKGSELIKHINTETQKLYKILGITKLVVDPTYRFSCNGFVCVRIIDDNVHITMVGDSGFRINGKQLFKYVKQIDTDNSNARAEYIKKTGDIAGSRNVILPLLAKQFDYQNNEHHELGYGSIDGSRTPKKFIHEHVFPLKEIKTLELFTDGYFKIPKNTTIKAWEQGHEEVEQEDPDKWKKYKSTKSKDDRTVAIITFG